MLRRRLLSERGRICHSGTIACLFIALGGSCAVAEGEPVVDGNAELADLLASAREYDIRATQPEAKLKFHEPSLLNFTNPERNQERGSVFVWMDNDRPAAIGQFFRFSVRGQRLTKHALHSL